MSKGWIRKSLSFLMVLFMFAALMPPVSRAADNGTSTLYYNSNDAKLHYGSTTGTVVSDISGWSGNGSTLTLTNFSYTTTADCALVMSGKLVLVGNNTLNASRRTGTDKVVATLLSSGSLEITGESGASLTLEANDTATDPFPERCIYTSKNLTLSGGMTINATAEGTAGARTIDAGENLYISGSVKVNSKSTSQHSSWAVVARNLYMSGGTIFADSVSTSGGGGLWLLENLGITGGAIYAKGSSVAGSNAVSIKTVSSSLSVKGSTYDNFDDSNYTITGALTKLNKNGSTGNIYRAVPIGENGSLTYAADLFNVKIEPPQSSGSCSLTVAYRDAATNSLVGNETKSGIASGTVIAGEDLNIPDGYKLASPFSMLITADASTTVLVEKLPVNKLTVNYFDENNKSVGSEVLTVTTGTQVTEKDFHIPAGYEFKGSYGITVSKDETISVTVYKSTYTITIEYRDENNWLVDTQKIQAARESSVTDAKLTVPAGYKLKDKLSMLATKDETVVVTVIKDEYMLTVEYRDENNWLIGSETIPVSTSVVVTVTERNLNIPKGYRLKDSGFSKDVTKDETVSVTVVSTDDDFNASPWAQEQLKKADEYGIIPDSLRLKNLTLPISRAEFAAVSVKVYESLMGVSAMPSAINPFTDTSDSEVLKAYNVGITNGTSATTFSPEFFLNREQAATMLTRVFKRVAIPGWTLATDSKFTLNYTMPPPFADDAYISSWAKNSVYFLAANGVIEGIGSNMYAPRNTTAAEEAIGYATTTREQAVAMALRMIQNLKP